MAALKPRPQTRQEEKMTWERTEACLWLAERGASALADASLWGWSRLSAAARISLWASCTFSLRSEASRCCTIAKGQDQKDRGGDQSSKMIVIEEV